MLAQSFLVLTGVDRAADDPVVASGSVAREATDVPCARTFLLATVLVFGQLGLGAAMRHRHAGLAVPDFPLAYGRVWPRTDAASIARYNQQRIEVVAAHPITRRRTCCCTWRIASAPAPWSRRSSWPSRGARRPRPWASGGERPLWLGFVLTQFALGAVTVWTNKAADIATAHVAVGSLVLLTGGLLCAVACARVSRPGWRPSASEPTARSGALRADGPRPAAGRPRAAP